ncbi:MAG: hypothetical protein R3B91_13935 [Planctomycetaceae bacterium]
MWVLRSGGSLEKIYHENTRLPVGGGRRIASANQHEVHLIEPLLDHAIVLQAETLPRVYDKAADSDALRDAWMKRASVDLFLSLLTGQTLATLALCSTLG